MDKLRYAATLEWDEAHAGKWLAQVLYTLPNTKLKRYRYFATVRRLVDANGLLQGSGWAVMRTGFEDLREFDTLDMAKLYVESIYELERS